MSRDERALVDRALRRARLSAYPSGEFVGQESFMRASEILDLAARAGIGPGVAVLDLCCGVAGPGRLITRELGCTYVGLDASEAAIGIARDRAGDLDCRFTVRRIPPIPPGRYDVVLLLETMLAFPDKDELLHDVATALHEGGRFAFTFEEGLPLTAAERALMPNADTVWLVTLPEMLASLDRAGLRVRWQGESSQPHRAVADSLLDAFTSDASYIDAHLGHDGLEELLTAHRLWSDWLGRGRARKFALIADKPVRRKGSTRRRVARRQHAASC